jgi:hypothetical protein
MDLLFWILRPTAPIFDMSSQYQFMITIVNSLFLESAVHFAQDSIPLMRIQSIDVLAEED